MVNTGTDRDVVVVSAVRTAIEKYGGGLSTVPVADLAAQVTREWSLAAGSSPAPSGMWCSAM